MTNCLNFGNPEKPEVYYQLEEAIRGMADAARALGIPVISGNVSLYNETNGEAIWPTPVVGVVGLIDDVDRVVPMGLPRRQAIDVFLLHGQPPDGGESYTSHLDGSAYLSAESGLIAGAPRINLDVERRLQDLLIIAAQEGLVASAHDVSAGGLAVAVAKASLAGAAGTGAHLPNGESDFTWVGEAQSAVLVSCEPEPFRLRHSRRSAASGFILGLDAR